MPIDWADRLTFLGDDCDQSTDLPSYRTLTLPTPERKLDRTEQYEAWKVYIEDTLIERELHSVISDELERPWQENAPALNWIKVSVKVANWMKNSLGEAIFHQLCLEVKREKFHFADEVYRAIKNHVKGKRTMLGVGFGVMRFRTKEYGTPRLEAFPKTADYIERVMQLRAGGIHKTFPPLQAWTDILFGIRPRYGETVASALRKLQYEGSATDNFTEENLLDEVTNLMDELNYEEDENR